METNKKILGKINTQMCSVFNLPTELFCEYSNSEEWTTYFQY
jgi:hypothetical protein